MISEKQRQIIKLLLTNKEGYNVNQIARLLNISVSWVHETLKLLEKEGILLSVRLGNAIFFRLNWQNQKAQKITELILLDEKEQETNKNTKDIVEKDFVRTTVNPPVTPKEQSVYSNAVNQVNYSGSQTGVKSYGQASGGYNTINPVGQQGVSNVLFSYAESGAFSSGYGSSSNTYSRTPVPSGTLGSRISGNVSSFTLSQHTTSHQKVTSGCRYCG